MNKLHGQSTTALATTKKVNFEIEILSAAAINANDIIIFTTVLQVSDIDCLEKE